MRIGIHAGSRDVDQIAKECNRVGVNEIFLGVGAIPELDRAKVEKFKDDLMKRGVKLSGMIMPVPSKEAVLGNNDAEVDRLCEILRAIGQAGIETVLFYPLDSFIH